MKIFRQQTHIFQEKMIHGGDLIFLLKIIYKSLEKNSIWKSVPDCS